MGFNNVKKKSAYLAHVKFRVFEIKLLTSKLIEHAIMEFFVLLRLSKPKKKRPWPSESINI